MRPGRGVLIGLSISGALIVVLVLLAVVPWLLIWLPSMLDPDLHGDLRADVAHGVPPGVHVLDRVERTEVNDMCWRAGTAIEGIVFTSPMSSDQVNAYVDRQMTRAGWSRVGPGDDDGQTTNYPMPHLAWTKTIQGKFSRALLSPPRAGDARAAAWSLSAWGGC